MMFMVNKREKNTASSRQQVSTIGVSKSPKVTEPGVRKGKRSLMACRARYKWSVETTHNSVKHKIGIKITTLVKRLIVWGKSEFCEKGDRLGSHCNWPRVRMSFNIHERGTSNFLIRSTIKLPE